MLKRLLALVIVAALLVPVVIATVHYEDSSSQSAVRVLLVRGEGGTGAGPGVAAWTDAAREVGVPSAWTTWEGLLKLSPQSAVRADPDVVFPDAAAQGLPDEVLGWTKSYVSHGGHLLVVYDAGTSDQRGTVRPSGLFGSLLGIGYSADKGTGKTYTTGEVRFSDTAQAAQWNVPVGKLTSGTVLSGYGYGPLTYPLAVAHQSVAKLTVVARSGTTPVLTTRRVGQGLAIWSALPLGHLSAYSTDSMPIDLVLQTVAVNLSAIPRILLAPNGGGGLVIDWHVESSADWIAIPAMEEDGLLRPGIDQEFDISAGPDEKVPGDGLGFNACGNNGKADLSLLLLKGESIGSDAGGVQDLFATQLEKGELSDKTVSKLVAANASCLKTVIGAQMHSYVGPDGVFPQPEMTKIIQQLGFTSYYYTGDGGSGPQLAFWNGKSTSSSVWAFPVAAMGKYSALADMAKAHIPAATVETWLKSEATYAANEGTIQLVYSHPPDLDTPGYTAAYNAFLGDVLQLQNSGKLVTESMATYANFLNRRSEADMTVSRVPGGFRVVVTDPLGLHAVALGVPSSWRLGKVAGVSETNRLSGERSYVVNSHAHKIVLRFSV